MSGNVKHMYCKDINVSVTSCTRYTWYDRVEVSCQQEVEEEVDHKHDQGGVDGKMTDPNVCEGHSAMKRVQENTLKWNVSSIIFLYIYIKLFLAESE